MIGQTRVLVDGLGSPECPRWHNGKLWFSDMHTGLVMTVDLDGHTEVIVEVPGKPAGLGWLPDGRLLVVSMQDRRLLRLDAIGLVDVADLHELASFHCNDMVVDPQGRAYIGNFGSDFTIPPYIPKLAEVILVRPDGQAGVVADGLAFPNGSVITPDGNTLIVAETFAARLAAFTIKMDGTLSHHIKWAQFDNLGLGSAFGRIAPDGICLDAENAIWLASPIGAQVLRVLKGGTITHRVETAYPPYACMLGGPDRRTLFILTGPVIEVGKPSTKSIGRIETIQVDIPGTGYP
ncbi:MAG: SMP-30/gluconolactonase/LRE family protein [Chloroflexi bacterium]|nr:SMP-30/gluconolactonase/LRE family protein [Chloroflexota bacterium]